MGLIETKQQQHNSSKPLKRGFVEEYIKLLVQSR